MHHIRNIPVKQYFCSRRNSAFNHLTLTEQRPRKYYSRDRSPSRSRDHSRDRSRERAPSRSLDRSSRHQRSSRKDSRENSPKRLSEEEWDTYRGKYWEKLSDLKESSQADNSAEEGQVIQLDTTEQLQQQIHFLQSEIYNRDCYIYQLWNYIGTLANST